MKNTATSFAVPGFGLSLDELCTVLIDGAAEPLLVIDTDYRVLVANPAAGRWLGSSRSDLLETSLLQHLPSGDSSTLLAFFDRCFHGGGHAQQFDLGGRKLHWIAQPLHGRDGALHGILCRVQDHTVTEQNDRRLQDLQRAVQEKDFLLRSRARLAGTLIEASPGLTFVLDRNQRFCAANQSYLSLVSRSIDELMGQTLEECFPRAAHTPLPGKIVEALEGKSIHLANVPCWLHDGTCNIQLTPLTFERFVYGVLVVTEITARDETSPSSSE